MFDTINDPKKSSGIWYVLLLLLPIPFHPWWLTLTCAALVVVVVTIQKLATKRAKLPSLFSHTSN
jgi:hypothetical protein